MSVDNRAVYTSELEDIVESDNVGSTSSVPIEHTGSCFILPEQATEDESSGPFTPHNDRTSNFTFVPQLYLRLPPQNDSMSLVVGEPLDNDSSIEPVPVAAVQPRFYAYGQRKTRQSRYTSSQLENSSSTISKRSRFGAESSHVDGPLQRSLRGHATSSTFQTPVASDPSAATDRASTIHLGNLLSYRRIYLACRKFKDVIIVTLGVLLVFQLFLVMYNSFVSFDLTSSHSGCKCSFPFSWLLVFSLRVFSRVVIPFGVAALFIHKLVMLDHIKPAWTEHSSASVNKGKTVRMPPKDSLHMGLLNPEIVKSIILLFYADRSEAKTSLPGHLAFIRQHFGSNLKRMLSISLLQPVALFFALYLFNVFGSKRPGITWADFLIGIADMTSMSLASAATGVMLSFYFTEMSMSRYICKLYRGVPGAKRTLLSKAKHLESYVMNRWYILEIGMQYSCVIYPLLLMVSWASDVPLSCGFSVNKGSLNQDSAVCWLVFIVAITVGQFMISTPLQWFNFMRYVGLGTELLLLAFLWLLAPDLHWSEVIHILYAFVPVCFLMWYLVVSVKCQTDAVSRGKDLPSHISWLLSHAGLIVLVLLSMALSLVTEYGHVHPTSLDKYRN